MKKLSLRTDGLTGDNLAFVKMLNERFAELDLSQLSNEDVAKEVRSTLKGLINEKGETAVDFAKVSQIDFDKLSELMSEGDKGIRSVLKKQGELINSLKELGSNEPNRVKDIRSQIKDFHEKNKEGLRRFVQGESKSFGTRLNDRGEMEAGIDLQLRVPGNITVAGSSNGSAFQPQVEIVPGLVDLARVQPFIEDYANTANTNRSRIVWSEKYNPTGNAAFIAEGGVKPLIDFQWRTFESYAKKVADKIKVSTEALDDVDFLAAEIETELKYQVDLTTDGELLTGLGDGTSGATTLKGLASVAGGYTLTTVKTTTANNFDALRAAIAQIVSLNFNPTHVFINPIDGANMDLVKDANGRPLSMEYMSNGKIYRLQPIETNRIAVGKFLMGDMSKFKVRNYKPFAIYYGWVNDDFEKNLVTVIGERRLHSFVASNHVGAFVYETFANVKTALMAP